MIASAAGSLGGLEVDMGAPSVVRRKKIAVFLDANASAMNLATHAASLARRWDADLVAICTVVRPILPPHLSYARGKAACQNVAEIVRRVDTATKATARQLAADFADLCRRTQIAGQFKVTDHSEAGAQALLQAAHADLIVVGCREVHDDTDYFCAGKALLASGVPILVVPHAWLGDSIGERIVIGWNSTSESLRALSNSMSFLAQAHSVTMLVTGPESETAAASVASDELARQLNGHGARIAVDRLASWGFRRAARILGYAEQHAADLLVVSGSCRFRLTQRIFARTARKLLAQTSVPTLIST